MEDKEIINRILLVKVKRPPLAPAKVQEYVHDCRNILINDFLLDKDGKVRLFEGNVMYYPLMILSDVIKDSVELGFLDDANVSEEETKALVEALKKEIEKLNK